MKSWGMKMDNQKELEKYLTEVASRSAQTGVESVLDTNAGLFQMGDVFEAETKKGGKNYIVFFFVKNGFVYYCHGDRAKKVHAEHFKKMIDYGDLVPVPAGARDPERLSLSVLGMKAMSQGMTFHDYLKVIYGYGHGSSAGDLAK